MILLSVNFDRVFRKANKVQIGFTGLIQEHDDDVQRAVDRERRAMPHPFSQQDGLPLRDAKNSEAFHVRHPVGLLGIVWRPNVDQAVAPGRDQDFDGPHVPLGPIEAQLGRLKVQIPEHVWLFLGGQVSDTPPPIPARTATVDRSFWRLDDLSERGKSFGCQFLDRKSHVSLLKLITNRCSLISEM
jgi:hypothetical protein